MDLEIFYILKGERFNTGRLIKRQVIDKRGKRTTVWVKPGVSFRKEKTHGSRSGSGRLFTAITTKQKYRKVWKHHLDRAKEQLKGKKTDTKPEELAKKNLLAHFYQAHQYSGGRPVNDKARRRWQDLTGDKIGEKSYVNWKNEVQHHFGKAVLLHFVDLMKAYSVETGGYDE